MAVLNPEHLIEQAELVHSARPGRKPRQVDLRRSISTAYYAVFHQVLIAAADEFVGKGLRNDSRYSLVYRCIDHAAIRRICDEASRQKPSPKFRRFVSSEGFEQGIRDFSNVFLRLQELRHQADYDPGIYFSGVDALFATYLAKSAIGAFNSARAESRRLFLTLILFPPR